MTYDGQTHRIDVLGLPDGAEPRYKDEAPSDAGTYLVAVDYYLDGVYQTSAQATLTINQRPITITIHSQEMTEKLAVPDFTYDVVGGVDGDTLGITFITETTIPWDHEITASITNQNYDPTFVNGTLRVLPFPYEIGDVSKDGSVSIQDAAMLQLYLAELILLDEYQLVAGDLNEDQQITIHDIAKLQLQIANLLQIKDEGVVTVLVRTSEDSFEFMSKTNTTIKPETNERKIYLSKISMSRLSRMIDNDISGGQK